MAFDALVRECGGSVANSTSATYNITYTQTIAAGNSVRIALGWNGSGTVGATGLSDTRGNTYTREVLQAETTAPRCNTQIWVTKMDVAQIQSGDVLAVAFTIGTTSEKACQMYEVFGKEVADKTATSQSTSSTTSIASGTTGTTTRLNELVMVVTMAGAVQASWTPDAAYSVSTNNLRSTTTRSLLVEYKNTTALGAQSATGSIPTSTTYSACISSLIVPVYIKSGFATVGGVASGAKVYTAGSHVYAKSGFAKTGGVGAGASASVFQETGFAKTGQVAAGPSSSVFAETGRGVVGTVASGSSDEHHTKTGYGKVGGVASGSKDYTSGTPTVTPPVTTQTQGGRNRLLARPMGQPLRLRIPTARIQVRASAPRLTIGLIVTSPTIRATATPCRPALTITQPTAQIRTMYRADRDPRSSDLDRELAVLLEA